MYTVNKQTSLHKKLTDRGLGQSIKKYSLLFNGKECLGSLYIDLIGNAYRAALMTDSKDIEAIAGTETEAINAVLKKANRSL